MLELSMDNCPDKKKDGDIIKITDKDVQREEIGDVSNPFISFRYSYRSMSCFNGKTHVKSKEKRFENGKFESEEFEGTLDGNVYNKNLQAMQKDFFQMVNAFMKPLSLFFPGFSKDKDTKR
jgi:hypothetical protein